MSYQSWHIYGYGICVSDLEIESLSVFRNCFTMPRSMNVKWSSG